MANNNKTQKGLVYLLGLPIYSYRLSTNCIYHSVWVRHYDNIMIKTDTTSAILEAFPKCALLFFSL